MRNREREGQRLKKMCFGWAWVLLLQLQVTMASFILTTFLVG